MSTAYPAEIDSWIDKQDNVDYVMADYINELHERILMVETVLGINPQGPSATVSGRLDLLTP
jgi:hypothetical protein